MFSVMYGRGTRAANYERDRREEERFSLRQWCGRVTARRKGFFLCILGYTWALALFGMTINNEESVFFQTERSHVRSLLLFKEIKTCQCDKSRITLLLVKYINSRNCSYFALVLRESPCGE